MLSTLGWVCTSISPRELSLHIGTSKMEASEDNDEKIEVLQSTETDTVLVSAQSSNMTEEQWRAIKAILEFLLGYREPE